MTAYDDIPSNVDSVGATATADARSGDSSFGDWADDSMLSNPGVVEADAWNCIAATVAVSTVGRTSQWIETTYANHEAPEQFAMFGAEESQ